MGWAGYYPITYDHTKCGSADSSGFAALVYVSNATLKDVAHGGYVNSSTGADILFFSDSGLTTQIASQIPLGGYDPVNGILWARVYITTLSHSANGTVYLAAGNATPPARTSGVWDSNYKGVWDLSNVPTSVPDSTENGNNLTTIQNTSSTPGQVGNAGVFTITPQTNISQRFLTSASLAFSGPFTLETWVKPTDVNNYRNVFNCSDASTTMRSVALFLVNGDLYSLYWNAVGTIALSSPIVLGAWNHIIVVGTGITTTVFLNGAAVGSIGDTGATGCSSGNVDIMLGLYYGPNYQMLGAMQQFRLSNTNRSPSYATACFNNQKTPGNIGAPGFWTWGSWVAPSSGSPSLALMGVGL